MRTAAVTIPLGIAIAIAFLPATPAVADVIEVTETGDYGEGKPPIVGSLRWAVEVRAVAGDTITVNLPKPVRLKRALFLRRELEGVTIFGNGEIRSRPSGSPTLIAIAGSGQSLVGGDDRLKLVDVSLQVTFVEGAGTGISRIRATGKTSILCVDTNDLSIRDSRFNTDNLFTGSPIEALGCDGLKIVGNEFRSTRKRMVGVEDGRELEFRDNELGGDATLLPRSGEIVDNEMPTGRLTVGYTTIGIPERVVVEKNRVERLVISRYHTEVRDNRVKAPRGATAIRLSSRVDPSLEDSDPQPLLVSDNRVLRGGAGIEYRGTPGESAPTVISANRIKKCNRSGIRVIDASDLEVSGNRLTKCRAIPGILVESVLGPDVEITGNVVAPGFQVGISVLTSQPVRIADNDVSGASAVGILASTNGNGFLDLEDNDVLDGGGDGVRFGRGASGRLSGGTVHRNAKAGVLVEKDGRIEITQVSFTENGAPGIDLVPKKVTPNEATKKANQDLDWPEALGFDETGGFAGTTRPGARVEVFVVEGGARAGNPKNGEGVRFLGSAIADGAGDFRFPEEGAFDCTDIRRLTTTATVTDDGLPYTSEFSPNVKCDAGSGVPGDEDDDGVEDSSDECPGTDESVSADENGCAATETGIDGGYTAFCNDDRNCDFSGGFGGCIDCSVGLPGEVTGVCFEEGVCSVIPGGTLSVTSGRIEGPGATLDCADTGCLMRDGEDVICEGQGDDCLIGFADGESDACPEDEPCVVVIDRDLFADARGEPVSATVRKEVSELEGEFADGEFPFFGPGSQLFDGPTTNTVIGTADGVGDQRLRFWRNGRGGPPVVRIGEIVPTSFELGDLDCNGPVDPLSFTLPDGKTLAEGFEAELAAKLRCTFTNDFVPPTGGIVSTPINDLELIVDTANAFGLGPGRRVTASGTNGIALIDLDSGSVARVDGNLIQFTSDFLPALAAPLLPSPLDDDGDTLIQWSRDTSIFRTYDPVAERFPTFLQLGPGRSDYHYLGGEPSTEGALFVSGTSVTNVVPADDGSRNYDSQFPLIEPFAWVNQGVAPFTAFAETAGGPALVATNGSPSQLFVTDPDESVPADQVSLAANLGNDTRQLRCRDGLCASSNCGSDTLSIIVWDGAQSASVTANPSVGDCPIGLDVEPLGDGAIFLSTGFFDDTFTLTRVSSSGSIVSNETSDTPGGCTAPTSGVLFSDGSLALGCNGENVIAVIEGAWPAP